MAETKYWLKEKKFKWVVISWGRDTEHPNDYFKYHNGFEITWRSYRLIVEWLWF